MDKNAKELIEKLMITVRDAVENDEAGFVTQVGMIGGYISALADVGIIGQLEAIEEYMRRMEELEEQK